MPVVEESIVVEQPAGVVFDYLLEPTNLPIWESSVVEIHEVDEGPAAIGRRANGVNKVLGVRFDWVSEVVELERPSRVAWSAVASGDRFRFTVAYDVEPVIDGTKVTYHVEADAGLGGVFGRFADPLVAGAQRRTMRSSLENLAAILAMPAAT
jgi:uncharacterized membrane protein